MKQKRVRTLVLIVAMVALGLSIVPATNAAESSSETTIAQEATPTPAGLTATPLDPDGGPVEVPKSPTSRLAQTDPSLLDRTDDRPVRVMVKLDYDSVATYGGGIEGLEATSPEVTGEPIAENADAVSEYTNYVEDVEQDIVGDIETAVPAAEIVNSYQVAYGGLSMRLPANRIEDLLRVDGVVAVQRNRLAHPLTDATPEFLGATEAWEEISGPETSGEGVIVGVLDTGIWPEHPSYDDPGIDHPGGTYGCEFGDGSDPELGDPFSCDDKLIGAYAFLDEYLFFLDALPGEFCNNATGECSARDADGHGTHTSSTAAGSHVESAPIFGVERGPISGMAPGAHVIMYRVCLDEGCFFSDMINAVEQSIVDDIDVMNVSIGPFGPAYTDPIALAFLDAFASGILVSVSAGNSGPDAGTASDPGPWALTVGASTSNRHWLTTVHFSADGGATLDVVGGSVAPALSTPTPVVLAQDVPGYDDPLCFEEFPAADSADGLVVVCEGRVSRLLKSFNVANAGGEGTLLLNPDSLDLFTDNHYTPTVMFPVTDHDAVLDFLQTHTGVVASWDTGTATPVRGDRMTMFSSRGPAGDFINPDVTAPGIQILAGTTPEPHPAAIFSGVPGQLFQSIAGTSMSSPHAAGVSALVKAAHPDWTPGMIKSALMTSSVQDVLKEDGVTPADPFDRGAGSIRANGAIDPTIAFDVSVADYLASAVDPLGRINLNLPSVNAPTMSGEVTTTRTFVNVSGRQAFDISAESPAGTSITVFPRHARVLSGASQTIQITIRAVGVPEGQYFGQITIDAQSARATDAVLPVAFFVRQGAVVLEHACDPTTLAVGETAACSVTAQNNAPVEVDIDITVTGPRNRAVEVLNPSEGQPIAGNGFAFSGTLSPAVAPTIDSIGPPPAGTELFGYLPLASFGVPANPDLGDEGIINLGLPAAFAYLYGDESYQSVAMTSNGYAIAGGGTGADVQFVPQTMPDPAIPNNVLGALWTDLNQAAGGETYAAILSEDPPGTRTWIVLEWADVPSFSDTSLTNSFQIWIETAATAEGITFVYGTMEGSADPLNVGAENRNGTSGVNLEPVGTVPGSDSQLRIETSPPTPGGSITITYDARAKRQGTWDIVAVLTSNLTVGKTIRAVTITVTGRRRG